jgi:hypothetical protein
MVSLEDSATVYWHYLTLTIALCLIDVFEKVGSHNQEVVVVTCSELEVLS